jgi:hypothetical protein
MRIVLWVMVWLVCATVVAAFVYVLQFGGSIDALIS